MDPSGRFGTGHGGSGSEVVMYTGQTVQWPARSRKQVCVAELRLEAYSDQPARDRRGGESSHRLLGRSEIRFARNGLSETIAVAQAST